MNKTKSNQTTKWGTACAQCAAAKAKCSRTSETRGSKCDRCERLLKTCTERIQGSRKQRQSSTARKEYLYASSSLYVDTDGSLSPPSTTSTADFTSTSIDNLAADISLQQAPLKSATSSPLLSITLSPPPALGTSVPIFDNLQNCPCSPSKPTTDEDTLQTFLTQIQPTFPFILVPSNVDSQALAVERPVLMSAIRLAAATTFTATTNVSKSTLLSQVYQFVNHVSSMVMLSGERTLEMLMAAVMVLGRWRWWCEQHRGAFNSLLGIAEGLVQDLGLNCNPRQMKEEENMVTDIEKRLLLGVWYLRSCAAIHLSQLSPTVFTPYMVHCLKDLEMSSQLSDQVLVQAVKIQHLEERIQRLNDDLPSFDPTEDEANIASNFDVDVEIAGPPTRGMQYGGHHHSQGYRQQMPGQQWAAAGAQGWIKENAGAVMFWGQEHHVQQIHGQHGHQG